MESQRYVQKKYNELLEKVKTDEYYDIDLENRVNCYHCKCGHITKTQDIDKGVTPAFFGCEKCGEMAHSSFYHDIAPNQEPTIEWYRPTLKQVLKMRKNEAMLDHILSGGLDHRKIKTMPDDFSSIHDDVKLAFEANGIELPAFVVVFTCKKTDYKTTHWVSNTSRQDSIKLLEELTERLKAQLN